MILTGGEEDHEVSNLGVGPNADSTDWVVPLITICLASYDGWHCTLARYF